MRGSDRYWRQLDDRGELRIDLPRRGFAPLGKPVSKEAWERFLDKAYLAFFADALKLQRSAPLSDRPSMSVLSDFEPIIEDDMTFNPNAEGVYTNAEAADYLGLSPTYLHNMRHHKTGPKFTKTNGRIYYKKADLDAWNAERKAKAKARKEQARAKAEQKRPKKKAA